MIRNLILFAFVLLMGSAKTSACSILYYIDSLSGKIYAVNNEDYFYNVNAYIKIIPSGKNTLARLWYGWDNFAQGGINEAGLFFDGAATPAETMVAGYSSPNSNLGDEILASCKTVEEAIGYLENRKIGLTNGHLLFGDKHGNASVIEWTNGARKITGIQNSFLMVTNFLLTDTSKGNYPCPRYNAMEAEINRLHQLPDTIRFNQVGNIIAKAVQPTAVDIEGREYGTLYSTFINITDMEFIIIYKLDNSNLTRLNLVKEFSSKRKRKIKLR